MSLLFSISAVVTSIQAKSILDDLPLLKELNFSLSEIEVQRMQRTILRYKKTPGIKYWAMVFIWQYVLNQLHDFHVLNPASLSLGTLQ